MATKIEKTIARQKQKIAEGQYYEAHQHLRVITSRYLSSTPPNYAAAIDLLFSGALILLEASSSHSSSKGETNESEGGVDSAGSGGDLCMYLVDVYNRSETRVDSESRGRILRLLRAFPRGELTRKRFINDAIAWSAKFGSSAAGDAEIHHVAGQLYAREGDVYEAEHHLIHGTRDSAGILANLEFDWYTQDTPDTAPLYASRAVLPYLLVGNLRSANQSLDLFKGRLPASLPSEKVSTQTDGGDRLQIQIYPTLPLMNFLTLLLVAATKGPAARTVWAQMGSKYSSYLQDQVDDGAWDESLELIGQMYFGIRKPRQNNPLMDMMSSMLGGAMGGGGGMGRPGGGRQALG